MKNRQLLMVAALCATVSYAYAADPIKIGCVNLEYVVSMLPDSKKVEADLKAFELQLRNQLEKKAADFQGKLQSFQKGHATMAEAVKSEKERELQTLHAEIEQLQFESQNSMANKQMDLVKPMYEKVQKTIEALAKENKYTHVFNANAAGISVVLYSQEQYDLSDLVLKKLGINPTEQQKRAKTEANKPATGGPKTDDTKSQLQKKK